MDEELHDSGRAEADAARRARVADPEAVPNLARMYDYYLGGSHNFAVDRAAADHAAAHAPHARTFARANRAFLQRVVVFLLAQGVDQFLDLGSGIPTVGNVHEITRPVNPDARVAYVDHEPVAVAAARHLLAGDRRTTVTHADIRDIDGVLSAPGVAGLLDFARPVAVLAVAVLHALPDRDDPAGVVAGYRDACPAGSYLAISHLAATSFTLAEQDAVRDVLDQTPTPVTMRTRDEVAALLAGFTLVPPGVVLLPHWRPDLGPDGASLEPPGPTRPAPPGHGDDEPSVDRASIANGYAVLGHRR